MSDEVRVAIPRAFGTGECYVKWQAPTEEDPGWDGCVISITQDDWDSDSEVWFKIDDAEDLVNNLIGAIEAAKSYRDRESRGDANA